MQIEASIAAHERKASRVVPPVWSSPRHRTPRDPLSAGRCAHPRSHGGSSKEDGDIREDRLDRSRAFDFPPDVSRGYRACVLGRRGEAALVAPDVLPARDRRGRHLGRLAHSTVLRAQRRHRLHRPRRRGRSVAERQDGRHPAQPLASRSRHAALAPGRLFLNPSINVEAVEFPQLGEPLVRLAR